MQNASNVFIKKLLWIVWSLFFIYTLIQFFPLIENYLIGLNTEPRTVTARGKLAEDELSTIEIFQQASPSVVYIATKHRVVDFWTRNVLSVPKGTGSGFIWDDYGHVVTNYHVIKDASEATVRLNDGRTYTGVIIGFSQTHDLAVLKINVPFHRPPPVPLGSSSDLKVGQKVFAIGNPFGLDYTLTTGIVSALDRTLEKGNINIEHLIQTDAAINPGNSGGPLLDSAGRLIGINTAIFSPSGAFAGIGFAVPVDEVNRVVPQLISKGRYIRPSLGIRVDENINKIVSSRLDISGIMILQIEPGSAAAKAGLKSARIDRFGNLETGDIIQYVNGKTVEDIKDLLSILDDLNIGDEVTLKLWRQGEIKEVKVVLQ
jgi:S1-C subfamily serine protease